MKNNSDRHTMGSYLTIEPDLKGTIRTLPRKNDIVLHFVDFDGTILNDQRRFKIDPKLANYRGDDAYSYLTDTYSDEKDPTGFKNFVKLLDPKNHLLDGFSDFFDPKNPAHSILTAGNTQFQEEKIIAAGLGGANRILVEKAEIKPRTMLTRIIDLGYIPGGINFYDDRIKNFDGADKVLSDLLGIPVVFYNAIQDADTQTVRVEKRVSDILDYK